jgi:hypothetical protein
MQEGGVGGRVFNEFKAVCAYRVVPKIGHNLPRAVTNYVKTSQFQMERPGPSRASRFGVLDGTLMTSIITAKEKTYVIQTF